MGKFSKVDYAGRTVDLLLLKTILDVPVVNRRVDIDVSNESGEPMIVTGVEKLAQRYALCFINAMGSTKFVQYHGTNLVPQVARGFVYNMGTLELESALANMHAKSQIMAADSEEDTPDDERLVSSDIIDLVFSREKAMVKISVKLTTAAGKSYVYSIPVAVGVS